MKIAKILFTTLALVLVASVAFASEGGADPVMAAKAYATALGMAIAAGLCGIGQGMGVKSACEGIARNPEAGGQLSTTLILGLAFIESLAIYALVVNLILLFVV
ncbi:MULTISPECIES: ATP synthase F0 subunit C [unclassified Pseudodesulfovibrio]|uniref:ATP synthase F0 subunit C n=1 Tax=unclassified Pseudodesulfovibrio TaxID=2661612 RepID=UPI000FEB91AA|nr:MULTISPECIES: ATP synthase F0 subunit C [unclassified Pseudodesulfovibrio]MCJ2166114.1 ATP synthase F0 subunit C [Pseudodesulfovibrio sp. S3-i]RWU02408.1 ATP synthase F0 subunit C [Pseudodesulfovibrio sp. S3]